MAINNGIYYYKLVSPYAEDVTKNCKLSVNEIDSNFLNLKNADIKKAEIVRNEDDTEKLLVLTRNDGQVIAADLNALAFDMDVKSVCNEDGTVDLTIGYSGEHGKQEITINGIVTLDGIDKAINPRVMTKVISDNSLQGDGTIHHPLGLSGTYKPGVLAPVKSLIDITEGGEMPFVGKLGTRFITKEYVNDYGYLYNGSGVEKLQARLDRIGGGWRIPTKEDWDNLLNSLEPCEYQNHGSAECHKELGFIAGKFLKSECGWNGQPQCGCGNVKPSPFCEHNNENNDNDDYVDDGNEFEPNTHGKPSYYGVDKFGMTILPAGASFIDTHNRIVAHGFSEEAHFWTTTHICNDPHQDVYVKEFDWNKAGVQQSAECAKPYFSIRLVKDYDGENYFDSEYVDGVLYKTVLFPQSKQVWLAANYANKNIFDTESEVPDVVDVNRGLVNESRKEYFINEWNGHYWEKRILAEGETVIIENPCVDTQDVSAEREVYWTDKDGVRHCVWVEIPDLELKNLEYRVYIDENCDKYLVDTDELIIERVISVLTPLIMQEAEERKAADEALSGAIETEKSERISGDSELWEAIVQEAQARETVDNQQWDAISQEAQARETVDNQLWEAIAEHTSAVTSGMDALWEAIAEEASARTDVDNQQWDAINNESARAQDVEAQLWEGINNETARAQEVESQLWDGINGETERAQDVEGQLWTAINNETERAIARENEIDGQLIDVEKNPYVLNVAVEKGENNLTFESKDGNEEHFIKIDFNGNFGEI